MPKINARENTRNRAQAKKRERNRLLRAKLLGPAGGSNKSPAKTANQPKASPAG